MTQGRCVDKTKKMMKRSARRPGSCHARPIGSGPTTMGLLMQDVSSRPRDRAWISTHEGTPAREEHLPHIPRTVLRRGPIDR